MFKDLLTEVSTVGGFASSILSLVSMPYRCLLLLTSYVRYTRNLCMIHNGIQFRGIPLIVFFHSP